jgi:hypothetical protein
MGVRQQAQPPRSGSRPWPNGSKSMRGKGNATSGSVSSPNVMAGWETVKLLVADCGPCQTARAIPVGATKKAARKRPREPAAMTPPDDIQFWPGPTELGQSARDGCGKPENQNWSSGNPRFRVLALFRHRRSHARAAACSCWGAIKPLLFQPRRWMLYAWIVPIAAERNRTAFNCQAESGLERSWNQPSDAARPAVLQRLQGIVATVRRWALNFAAVGRTPRHTRP